MDGFKIRNTLDDDFAEVHQNLGRFSLYISKYYIPEGEIWVDYIFKKSGEVDYFITIDEEISKYFATQGYGKKERSKATGHVDKDLDWRVYLNDKMCSKEMAPVFEKRKEVVDGINVVYVDGAIVRRFLDCQFLYGGHDLVYSYIPKNTIWLDIVTGEQENKYFLIHEKKERDLMSEGMVYDPAHKISLAYDMAARIKDGVGMYPGDDNYSWTGLSNEEITKKYVTE